MKVLLTLKERILLLNILPREGTLVTQKIVKNLRDRFGVSDEDWKTYGMEPIPEMPGQVRWDITKDIGTDFELGDKSLEIIKESLQELDNQKKVTEDFLSLYDKFLPVKDAV